MNVIERRLEILRIMNAKRKSNVAELAEALNVSTRTVQRDIQALITVVPLVCISGNGGGIVFFEHASRPHFFPQVSIYRLVWFPLLYTLTPKKSIHHLHLPTVISRVNKS